MRGSGAAPAAQSLDDIEMLEQYVQMSMSTLIFLSRGYFVSKNCLREAESATALNSGAHLLGFKPKPIILVHEADLNHAILSPSPSPRRGLIVTARSQSSSVRLQQTQRNRPISCCSSTRTRLWATRERRSLTRCVLVSSPERFTYFDSRSEAESLSPH